MTAYFCPLWHSDTLNSDLNGTTVEEAYDEDACLDFSGSVELNFNSAGEVTSEVGAIDPGESLTCTQHWRTSYWEDDTYEAAFNSLRDRRGEQRVWLCENCGDPNPRETTIWESERAFQQHSDEEHETGYLDEQAELNFEPTPPPPPATRIPLDRVTINVAPGRTWFTREPLPDWVPPMVDDIIRRGQIQHMYGDRPAIRQPRAVMYREQNRSVVVRGESDRYLDDRSRWNAAYTMVRLYPTPPVRTSHSLFPGATP